MFEVFMDFADYMGCGSVHDLPSRYISEGIPLLGQYEANDVHLMLGDANALFRGIQHPPAYREDREKLKYALSSTEFKHLTDESVRLDREIGRCARILSLYGLANEMKAQDFIPDLN